jgi:hypothetical protein
MAFQYPNFLGVPVRETDYSGIGDSVSNFYAGKGMRNNAKSQEQDALLKAIQLEFARPNAEQGLIASKLGNQSTSLSNRTSQLNIQKLASEMAQQKAFEQQLKQALMNSKAGNVSGAMMPQPAMPQGEMGASPLGNVPQQIHPQATQAIVRSLREQFGSNPMAGGNAQPEEMQGFDPGSMDRRFRKFDAIGQNGFPSDSGANPAQPQAPMAAGQPQAAPMQAPAPQPREAPHEVVLEKGEDYLQGVNDMWDSDPSARAYLKKKGYEKTQKVDYDKKTGKTTVTTKYPNGKITIKTDSPELTKEELSGDIPLTKPVLNKVVNQIRGTDAVIPYIDKLIDMAENSELPHFSGLPTDAHAKYKRTVSELLEKYMAATGLNQTDMSTQKVQDIVERSFGESTAHYLKELKAKKIDLIKERARNHEMVLKGLKKFDNFDMSNTLDKSESSDPEAAALSDSELEESANG